MSVLGTKINKIGESPKYFYIFYLPESAIILLFIFVFRFSNRLNYRHSSRFRFGLRS